MRNGIFAAGNWIVDRIKHLDRWPEEGELCNIRSQEISFGGGPCNVLFDLAALRCSIPLYAAGTVGCDQEGEELLQALTARGIDGTCMRRQAGKATSFTEVLCSPGKRTFFHCRGANSDFSGEEIDAGIPAKIFYLGYLLLLDQLDALDPEYGTCAARLLAGMRERGFLTAVDMVSEDPEKFTCTVPPALPHTDFLIINEIEAGNLYGQPLRSGDGVLDYSRLLPAVERLLELGVKRIAVIHFPEGAFAMEHGGTALYSPSCHVPAEEMKGTTGAGDAFAAGFLYACHEELSLAEMLRYASASAAFNLTSADASGGAPDLDTLEAFLKSCRYLPVPDYFKEQGR